MFCDIDVNLFGCLRALLREKNVLNYLISPLSVLFWPEGSRNSSTEVIDLGLNLTKFSNIKGESNGLISVGGCGAVEGNPEKQSKPLIFSRCLPLGNLQRNTFNVGEVVHLTLSLPLY